MELLDQPVASKHVYLVTLKNGEDAVVKLTQRYGYEVRIPLLGGSISKCYVNAAVDNVLHHQILKESTSRGLDLLKGSGLDWAMSDILFISVTWITHNQSYIA